MSRSMAMMKDEDGRFMHDRAVSVSIHAVTAEDIGKSCDGLLYTDPDDTLNMVNSRGQIVLRLGGDSNMVYLNNMEAAEELVNYLTAAIYNIHNSDTEAIQAVHESKWRLINKHNQ